MRVSRKRRIQLPRQRTIIRPGRRERAQWTVPCAWRMELAGQPQIQQREMGAEQEVFQRTSRRPTGRNPAERHPGVPRDHVPEEVRCRSRTSSAKYYGPRPADLALLAALVTALRGR